MVFPTTLSWQIARLTRNDMADMNSEMMANMKKVR